MRVRRRRNKEVVTLNGGIIMRNHPARFAFFGALFFLVRAAHAQADPEARPVSARTLSVSSSAAVAPAEAYGPGTLSTMYPPAAFFPASSAYSYAYTGDKITPTVNGEQHWTLPLDLPSGASMQAIDVFVVDNDASQHITVQSAQIWFPVSGSGGCGSSFWTTASSVGSGQEHVVINNPYNFLLTGRQVCNSVDSYTSYLIDVFLENTNHSLSGARAVWTRTISPAPATATFNDVPTSSPIFQFVEALAASGITAGCGGGNYCPNNPLTRGQMAVYLAKALGLHWPE
jgi:hypothetical protein